MHNQKLFDLSMVLNSYCENCAIKLVKNLLTVQSLCNFGEANILEESSLKPYFRALCDFLFVLLNHFGKMAVNNKA